MQKNSFTFKLTENQQRVLADLLRTGNYRPREVQHTVVAAEGENCQIALYKSGKCLVQGKGAQDWVSFVLEPLVLQEARVGYEDILDPESSQPHMGIDESGKGDYFGPLVIAAAYVNADTTQALRDMGVKDSKNITSDQKAEDMAKAIRKEIGDRFSLVTIGPEAYNRLYVSMRNVNRILAWGHARVIENLLEKVPGCPRAVADQFGPARQVEQALMKRGRSIELIQRPRAESDPAVAAASVLARAGFVRALKKMQKDYDIPIPKGASDKVKETAQQLAERHGPEILLKIAKCHFKTTDAVLGQLNMDRSVLGKEGSVTSKPVQRR